MPLVIPRGERGDPTDASLLALAELLGVECVRPSFHKVFADTQDLDGEFEKNSCVVINPSEVKRCLGDSSVTEEFAHRLCSKYAFLLIYNLHADPFCEHLVRTLSAGCASGIENAPAGVPYSVPVSQKRICDPFAGLSVSRLNSTADFVLSECSRVASPLTLIGGKPQMLTMRRGNAQLFFLAAAGVADIHGPASNKQPKAQWFSSLVQPAMLLRHLFPEQFWRQNERYASLVVDDPPLWPTYGYLNYEGLLGLMDKHNFHTSVAFIPHNYRRSAPETVRLFRERPDRFSICFHGNDHTRAEFGESNLSKLNQLLRTATARMDQHQVATSLRCQRVMAFPQGIFSAQAMASLRFHNFLAAVNTEDHPVDSSGPIELGDLIKPAINRYGFPLFLRKPVETIAIEDVAFNLFFQKPVLIGAHHDAFKQPEILEKVVDTVNFLCPSIRWTNLESVVNNSYLTRKDADGVREIQYFSNLGSIENHSDRPVRMSIELPENNTFPEHWLVLNGQCDFHSILSPEDRRFSLELAPGKRCLFDSPDAEPEGLVSTAGIASAIRSFCRRRLSEFRDNYLIKSPGVLTAARILQRRMQGLINLVV
jgi:hypothetical protein